jgi:uncharacterized protein DUF559
MPSLYPARCKPSLEDQGFRVMRFWNNEVTSNTGGVLATNPSSGTPFRGASPRKGREHNRLVNLDVPR